MFWSCPISYLWRRRWENYYGQSGRSQAINLSGSKEDKKTMICLEGKSMAPFQGNTILLLSYQQLFEPIQCPSKTLNLLCVLLTELQRFQDNVRCARIGAEVLWHYGEQLPQTLIVVFVIQKIGGARPLLGLTLATSRRTISPFGKCCLLIVLCSGYIQNTR